jgi:hypothetical protein
MAVINTICMVIVVYNLVMAIGALVKYLVFRKIDKNHYAAVAVKRVAK